MPQSSFGGARPVDQVIGKAIDGSPIKRSEITQLIRLFGPSGFNDGVLEKDFLMTKMASQLVDTYFDEIEGELKEKWGKLQKFQPYVHPSLPFIGVERLWEQVMPEQKQRFDAFKKSVCDKEGIRLLMDLYLGEMQFPPHIMRQFLLSAERQFPSVPGDPYLQNVDLTLFKCKSVQDLLGERFVDIVAQFIHNTALLAKKKGYHVSFEEARVELMQNATQFFSRGRGERDINLLIKQQIAELGMDERELVKAWQKILLFRRVFNDYGGSVLVDRLPFEQFESFASQGSQVDFYTMPIKIGDLNELIKFQFYIDAVTSEKKTMGLLDLPQTFLKPEQVAFDELVYKKYVLKVQEIDKGDVASKISLTETWNFEREHFDLLQETFPEIGTQEGDPDTLLDALTFELRLKVDEFAREQIVSRAPVMLMQALSEAPIQEKELLLSKKGPFAFDSILDREGFMALLDTQKELHCYSQDGKHYYQIEVVEAAKEPELFTFKKANELGILDTLVSAYLEKEYPSVRLTNPTLFQNPQGEWLSFEEAKPWVGQLVYGDILKALPGKTVEEKCHMRLKAPMEKALDHLKKGRRHLVKTEGGETSSMLADQWLLAVSDVSLRKGTLRGFSSSLLSMKPGTWSDVVIASDGEAQVCQVKKNLADEGDYTGMMLKSQADLSKEAKCFLMEGILKQVHDAIY